MINKLITTVLFVAVVATSGFSNSFSCYGEAEGMLLGADLSDAETFVEMQLQNEENLIGQQHCVIAELMKRLGDTNAEYHYKKAIAMDPDEPGWELWYANYLTQVRGSMVPLREQGKIHYLRAIEKLKNKYGGSLDNLNEVDKNLYSWIQRGYSKMYQEDGIAITPWTWPALLGNRSSSSNMLPEIFVTYTNRYTRGLSEFDKPDFTRSRASEAVWVKNADFQLGALSPTQLERIATHDNGLDFYNTLYRARLRHPFISIDAYRRDISIDDAMIESSMLFSNNHPFQTGLSDFTTLKVIDQGLVASRNFNLYPVFDVYWEAAVRAQERKGFIEWYPDATDWSYQFDTKMKISRFIGPDKLIIDLFYMDQNIQNVTYPTRSIWDTDANYKILPGIGLERDRYMWGVKFDYALYRPIRFPFQKKAMYTRGWHWYGGIMFDSEKWFGTDNGIVKPHIKAIRDAAEDDIESYLDLLLAYAETDSDDDDAIELDNGDTKDRSDITSEDAQDIVLKKDLADSLSGTYGPTLDSANAKVQNTDIYFGTHLKGIGPFNFQLQGTMFYTKPFSYGKADESLLYTQIFGHILTRFIDEDVVPGMPNGLGGLISPVFLQLSVPASYDFAIDGPIGYENKFDNWKVQAELQAKLMINPLGTYIILTGGYGRQQYVNLDVGFPIYSGSVNVGWKF